MSVVLNRAFAFVHRPLSFLSRAFNDTVLIGLLAVVSAVYAASYTATWEGNAQYLQKYMGAVVMLTLGHGFEEPQHADAPAIMEFLNGTRRFLDPLDVPANVRTVPAMDFYAQEHLYFSYLLAGFWHVFGIHWGVMIGLYAFFFSLSIVVSYGLLRQFSGRILSTAGTVMVMLSPGFLFILPHFRDFSKAPFILLLLLCLALLLRTPRPRTVQFLLAGIIGLAAGTGFGFRQDLMIVFPGALAALTCFWPGTTGKPWQGKIRRALLDRLAGAALSSVIFAAAAYPMFVHERETGSQSLHRLAGGLAAPIGHDLGVGGVPYEPIPLFLDEFIWASIASHNLDRNPEGPQATYRSPEYDRAGLRYYLDYARIFPGDIATRWIGAGVRILNHEAFSTDSSYEVGYSRSRLFWKLHELRMWIGQWLDGSGVLLACIVVAVLCVRQFRLGLATAFSLYYFTGYTSLQWHERHSFHLEVMYWCLLAAVLHGVFLACVWLSRNSWREKARAFLPTGPRAVLIPLASMALPVLLIATPLWAARAVQSAQVSRLYGYYERASLRPLSIEKTTEGNTKLAVRNYLQGESATEDEKRHTLQSGMIMAEIQKQPLPFTVQLEVTGAEPRYTYVSSVQIPPLRAGESEDVRLFYPVYSSTRLIQNTPMRRFGGLRIPNEFESAVRKIYAVENADAIPFRMALLVEGTMADQPRFMRHMPEFLPLESRAIRARGQNLLANGGCETWDAESGLPLGAIAQSQTLIVQQETRDTYEGASAARISWRGAPPSPVLQRFAWFTEDPGSDYFEFFVRAKNPDGLKMAVEVLLVQEAENNPSGVAIKRLGTCILTRTEAYREFSASFFYPEIEGSNTLLFCPVILSGRGGSVLLDDLRLVRSDGPQGGPFS